MTDQQRWDGLGAVSDWASTPHMDRIAAEGVRFPNAYTNSPVCTPARVTLATGRYPHNNGVWANGRYTLPADEPTWMRGVQDAGYSTSVFGKTHLHPHRGDLRDRVDLMNSYGLAHVDEIAGPRAARSCRSNLTDLWEAAGVYEAYKQDMRERLDNKPWVVRPSPLPFDLYPDVYVGRQATEYLTSYDQDQPWFCWVSFSGPHEPWDAPEPYASRFEPKAMPEPLRLVDEHKRRPRGLLDERMANGGIPFKGDDIARLRANYAGNLALIDDQVGDILAAVEARGELDNTVIALCSDHGEMNGDFGLLYKQNFLNPAVRIPFVVRLPPGDARAAPGVADTVVELMDLGATLVEIAGGTQRDDSHAISALPVLDDLTYRHRESALSEFSGEIMLATPEWKSVLNRRGQVYLLFDLQADPHESRNLAGSPKHARAEDELRRLTLEHLVQTIR